MHNTSSYRPDIDGLRAVAVLSVVFCHAGLGFPGGFVGVDLFFVISGFLITGLILKDLELNAFSAADFWERRVRRILPALVAVTVATTIAGWWLLLPNAYTDFGASLLALALFASNIYFWRDTNYFASDAQEKPLLHTWSLAVEEQFYFLVPLLLLAVAQLGLLHRVAWLLAAAAVSSFALSVYGVAFHPEATFYLLPTRAWELLAGSLLATAPAALRNRLPSRTAHPLGLAALGSVLAPCFLYDHRTPFPGLAATPAVLGSVLLIALGERSIAGKLLASRVLVFFGLISYSLYLWHWPVLALLRYQSLREPSLPLRLTAVIGSVAAAVASWRYVETPFRRRSALRSRPRLAAAAAASLFALLLAGACLKHFEGVSGRMPPAARLLAETSALDPTWVVEREAGDVPTNLKPLGPKGEPELLVWGDSHAMAVLPCFDALCEEAGVPGVAATRSSTAPAVDYFLKSKKQTHSEKAPAFNAAVMKYVRSHEIGTVVLVASWSSYARDADFSAALLRTVDLLRAAGVRIYFMKDVPHYPYDIAKALALYSLRERDLDQLSLPRSKHISRNRFEEQIRPELESRGVVVIDPLPALSPTAASLIPPFDAHGSLYRDAGHLSTHGAMALKPLFEPIVAEAAKRVKNRSKK